MSLLHTTCTAYSLPWWWRQYTPEISICFCETTPLYLRRLSSSCIRDTGSVTGITMNSADFICSALYWVISFYDSCFTYT
jgi:hypothetical protein